ncbi:hypothetical protein [Agromyces mangrovi Wang et al. 2018]|uniref:hypothetical protein n=1 Tax=Agromyces mangrovi TaxID=1858653 RepID=UPI00257325AB|nr:hypothetical protein [Agromyces mangrovi]BDZ66351.1 hypothetical protein GCM10025877_32890 [Agromyces mangrovi]
MSPSTPDRSQTDRHDEPAPLSRRGIVAGAAWALPTIALAATVPVAAASEPAPVCVLFEGTGVDVSTDNDMTIYFDYAGRASAAIAAGMVVKITAIEGQAFNGIGGDTNLPQVFPVNATTLTPEGWLVIRLTRANQPGSTGEVRVTVQQLSGEALCGAAAYVFRWEPGN